MKAIFVSQNAGSLARVYPARMRELMAEKLEFLPELNDASPESLEKRRDELNSADVIFSTWGMPAFTRAQIAEYFSSLRAVFYGAGSVQSFAREFLDEGKTVVSAWAANAVPVAEYTVAQIILANKGYFQKFMHSSAEAWDNRGFGGEFNGNYGAKVGIIGAGMIGKLVISMLKRYELEIMVFDPFLPDEKAVELGVKKTSLEELFSECDVITNHLANNPQTVGMLGAQLFSRMKPNAAFINTGRGAQVVEAALADAMREVPTRAALLDVTLPEPPVNGSELYRLPNVFLSPHIAGSLGREVERMGGYMWDEYLRFSSGEPLKYAVSKEMLATMA